MRFNKSHNQHIFRGKCHTSNGFNHNARKCQFLKKLQSCLKHVEKNNIITSQGRRFYDMNNNNNRCNSEHNAIKNLQDENFIPFENVDRDVSINALEDDIVCHVIDDHDYQE